MEFIKINQVELSALRGLPHMQQILYLVGIKPYIDYQTGIVGLARGISYQSLSEELYIEPHPGIKSGSPSKDQLRRAIKGLEKSGILKIQSMDWKLIFHCPLITLHSSVRNKAAINPHTDVTTNPQHNTSVFSEHLTKTDKKHAMDQIEQPAIPLEIKKNMCVYTQFGIFWSLYPKKCAKQKAFDEFKKLQLTEELCSHLIEALQQQLDATRLLQEQGQWIPKWKFPANWLAQHCWEDELPTANIQEKQHATPTKIASSTVDLFWESCKAGASRARGEHILQGSQS